MGKIIVLSIGANYAKVVSSSRFPLCQR